MLYFLTGIAQAVAAPCGQGVAVLNVSGGFDFVMSMEDLSRGQRIGNCEPTPRPLPPLGLQPLLHSYPKATGSRPELQSRRWFFRHRLDRVPTARLTAVGDTGPGRAAAAARQRRRWAAERPTRRARPAGSVRGAPPHRHWCCGHHQAVDRASEIQLHPSDQGGGPSGWCLSAPVLSTQKGCAVVKLKAAMEGQLDFFKKGCAPMCFRNLVY